MKVDLYLGSDIGLWVLENIQPDIIKHVITLDDAIYEKCNDLGIETIKGNANTVEFNPSDIGFSVHYPRIIKPPLISKYKKIYNLHPGYLPWGRGFYPVFWALFENTPAGVTLHEITEGVDEGPIVHQSQVEYTESDTGYTVFERAREVEKKIFLEYFPRIFSQEEFETKEQQSGGSYHNKKEFFELKAHSNWDDMSARELVHLVRCLTFPEYSGLEINIGEKKFSLSLEIID